MISHEMILKIVDSISHWKTVKFKTHETFNRILIVVALPSLLSIIAHFIANRKNHHSWTMKNNDLNLRAHQYTQPIWFCIMKERCKERALLMQCLVANLKTLVLSHLAHFKEAKRKINLIGAVFIANDYQNVEPFLRARLFTLSLLLKYCTCCEITKQQQKV